MWRGILAAAVLAVLAIGAQTPRDTPKTGERDRKINYDGTPLWKAKLALETARSRVLEDRYPDAVAALRDTRRALTDFESGDHGPHAEMSQYIREQISAYEEKMVRLHDQEDALDRIALWLEPVNRWYEASIH
jgi:hypothetical protein